MLGVWSFLNGVPSRTLTSNLEFRTLPLCALSYGDRKGPRTQRPKSAVGLAGSLSIASSPEERSFLLLVKPAKEPPKPRIKPDLFNCVELVAQFIMRPRFVDEILT